MQKIILIITVLLLATTSFAGQKITKNNNIIIKDAWVRVGSKGGNSAIYLQIINNTTKTETLLDATSQIAAFTEIHKSVVENDIAQMVQISKMAIPAATKVEFLPGGLHVMLFNLTNDLHLGDIVKLTLDFETSGKIVVEARVAKAAL